MMMSFETIYEQVQQLANDSSTAATTLIKNLVNQTQGVLLALRKDITEGSATDTTVASQQAYYLPYNYGKMILATVTVGSIIYPMREIEDDVLWRQLNARGTSFTSNIPQFFYIFNDQIYIYPTPSSASNTITMYYHKIVKDMTADDYVTGTITTLANAGTAVTGSSTVWTALMVGRFLRVTNDGFWYEIASRTSNTAIALKKKFQGTAISAGSDAYIIGEMSLIPENYNDLLVWRPTAIYYQQKGETAKAKDYWMMYDGGYSIGLREKPGAMVDQFINDRSSKVESAVISGELARMKRDVGLADPNKFPQNLTS